MTKINENFLKLTGNYLFSEIARRVAVYQREHPDKKLIRLGIGDVTLPLAPAVTEAMGRAVEEMSRAQTFRGYGPEQGYDFLRKCIAEQDYRPLGVELAPDEIFVSDGAKSDCGNIGDIFAPDNIVAVCDPVYTVYVDTNVMAGRAGEYKDGRWTKLLYMPCVEENNFTPMPPMERAELIYLCFPNNPTGATATREQLRAWVRYARENESVILYDAAYKAYISQPEIPRSIYEIEGAKECAIEFCSYSKTAGFTGTRCAYTAVPKALRRGGAELNALWNRRQTTKFNGVPYVVQRGAEATYSEDGKRQLGEAIAYYMNNARIIREGLAAAGLTVFGGVNAPYIWARIPGGGASWDFFDLLLQEANVVTTPGAGFGPSGEGYIRLTAFGNTEATREAVERIGAFLKR